MILKKAVGCLSGAAVGDSLGGSTEGYSPEQIQKRFGGYVDGIVGPFHEDWKNHRPVSPFHKGDGHITDDTLMTEALINVYSNVRNHLDAYSFAENIVPELIERKRWIPELEREDLLVNRIFHAEKWLVHHLKHANIDPREAGMGNIVNCGATMYIAPVGIINAGNPKKAYSEAIDIAGAHQSSYGREAAGVQAAAVATAMSPNSSVQDVLSVALEVSHDGTKAAIRQILEVANNIDDWKIAIPVLRNAIKEYDSVGDIYREPHLDARRPSRAKSIEELPIALGMLLVTKGNFREGILGSINYGRDSDSIATMFGAISGAINGRESIPRDWIETVEFESKINLKMNAETLIKVAQEIKAIDDEYESLVKSKRNELFS